MPFPSPNGYGIIDNPLIFTPFVAGSAPPGNVSANDFLLLDGTFFLLLNGGNLLLL